MFEQITDLGTNLGDLRSIRLTHLPTQACLGGFWVHNNGDGKRISAGCGRFAQEGNGMNTYLHAVPLRIPCVKTV